MKIVFHLLVLGFASAGHLPGAAADSSAKSPLPTVKPDIAAARTSVERAKIAAKDGNASAVERELTPLIRAKPETAAWHMEAAQRLVHVADDLAREAQRQHVAALAQRALQHLARADELAKDARVRAAGRTLAGFVHERYLGDAAAAIDHYEAARQLSPERTSAALFDGERLKRDEAARERR